MSFNRTKPKPTQTSGGKRNYDLYGQTVKNIPVTLGGPREWYPGAILETLPSVVADSGPSRTMHPQKILNSQSCQSPEMFAIDLPPTIQDVEIVAAQTVSVLDAFPIVKKLLIGQ